MIIYRIKLLFSNNYLKQKIYLKEKVYTKDMNIEEPHVHCMFSFFQGSTFQLKCQSQKVFSVQWKKTVYT